MEPWFFLSIAGVAVVVFVGLDLRAPAFRAAIATDRHLRLRNAGYVVGNIVSMTALAIINARVVALFHDTPQAGWWATVPVIIEVACAFVIAEAINWFSHWIKHVRPWLWTFHIQHHVGRHYDTTLTLHTHGVDVVISGAAMSFVLFGAGFSKLAVDVFVLSYFVTNLYKHCHAHMSLGAVLDKIVVGPAYHRIHHTPDVRGNYGSVLTLFDVAFGTAVWPARLGGDEAIYARDVGVAGVAEGTFTSEMLLPLRPR